MSWFYVYQKSRIFNQKSPVFHQKGFWRILPRKALCADKTFVWSFKRTPYSMKIAYTFWTHEYTHHSHLCTHQSEIWEPSAAQASSPCVPKSLAVLLTTSAPCRTWFWFTTMFLIFSFLLLSCPSLLKHTHTHTGEAARRLTIDCHIFCRRSLAPCLPPAYDEFERSCALERESGRAGETCRARAH